ncbi:PAS/PAC sensor signal transduction histidine kinase [Fibrisoma limi BUZ 3]|uniref:histidine kinase n=1 Tax=Fibrisoma limi BUZ 3 TaxID=1185876 RepID=I2GJK5_9BACT|nr:PAS domain-containing protein [Fibrisoma limi]CCH54080.1 PAS/PAC sensor signal transduction histidine kinase [Fibrisoma limi BUZ 3]
MPDHQQPTHSTPSLNQRLDVDFALRAAGLGVWEFDPLTRLLHWDDQCRQLFGLAHNNRLAYEQAVRYIHPDDVDRVIQAVQRAISPQFRESYDETYRTLGADDGLLRWVRFVGRSYFTETGELSRFGGIAQDVTQQVLTQQKLESSQKQILNQFEQTPVGIAAISVPELTFRSANPFYAQLVGRSPEQLINKPLSEAIPETQRQRLDQWVQQVMTTGQSYTDQEVPVQLIRRDQPATIYITFTYQPQRGTDGTVVGVLIVAVEVTQQVLARQEVLAEQSRLHTILEALPVGILIANAQGELIYGNPQVEQIFRHPFRVSKDIEAYKNWQLFDPLTSEPFPLETMPMVRTLLQGETVVATEMKLRRGDGSWGYATVNTVPVFDSQGAIKLGVAAFIDTTDRKQAEEALRQSEGRLRAVLESITDGLYIGGMDGITLANQAALEQLGFTSADELNRHISILAEEIQTRDWLSGELIPIERQAFARALGGEHVVQDVLVRHRLSGEDRVMRCAASPVVANGQVVAAVAINTDVTEFRLAETALRKSAQQQAFLLQLNDQLRPLDNPVAIQHQAVTVLGQYLGANRAGYAETQPDEALVAVTRNYVVDVPDLEGVYQYKDYGPALLSDLQVGKTVIRSDIAHDPTLTEAEKQAHAILELGATINVPLVKQGRLVAILFVHFSQPHHWSADEVALIEVTAEQTWSAVERARSEEALRQSEARYRQLSKELEARVQTRTHELELANQDLQRSNDNLQQFAYIASHDLQEPLRKIQSFSTLLGQYLGDQLDATATDYLERIVKSGSRMSRLIRDLLSYSRIATRQQTFGPISLDTVVAGVLDTLSLEIEQRQAQVEVDELPIVKGDSSQLMQLFQNLLSNALKFTPAPQKPQIRVEYFYRQLAELPAEVRPSQSAPFYHQISVSDQGIGFDMKYMDRIFQVFQRLHSKTEFPGTGVGLAICQRVIENHGGGITASSTPGQGATFCVYLPA